MVILGVIPARFASTRFPAKVLAQIGGKPMIEHVWRKAKRCGHLTDVIIACDHEDVAKAARGFGAQVVMTRRDHPSGSDRIAQAIEHRDGDVVINIQGDEPFIDPLTIDQLAQLFKDDPQCQMGTVIKPISDEKDFLNPNVVKCVVDQQGYALYFSRSPIPYNRNDAWPAGVKRYKHLGLYGYRRECLIQFTKWPKSLLESTEQLEQLRALENGIRIKTVETQSESIAVDTPDDLVKAEQFYQQKVNSR